MAELGSTTDPKALVPGNPETVHAAGEQLQSQARTMKQVADDLARIRIDGWEGKASSAFWDQFTPEHKNWMLGHDAMESAAKTVSSHAEALSWAQGQAKEAIALWEKGEAATKKAVADFQAGGGTFVPGQVPNARPGEPGGPVGAGFTDPGAALRQQAQQTLDRARHQLEESGKTAAAALDKHGGKASGSPSWLSGPAAFVAKAGPIKGTVGTDLKNSKTLMEQAKAGGRFNKYKQLGYKFPEAKQKGPDVNVQLASWSKEANLFKVGAKGATQIGDVTLAGSAEVKAGAEVGASGSIGRDGLKGEAHASAGVTATAQGSANYGIAEVGASGKAFAGAEAGAEGSVGLDGVHAGAHAFAGARAEGEVHTDVGGVGAGVKGEAWAGAGAEADFDLGKGKDGKWHIGGEVGAAVGVGGKVGTEITIDPSKVADTAGDAADAVGHAAGQVGHAAKDVVSTLNPF